MLDVIMTTVERPLGSFYLQDTLDGWAMQQLPASTEIHVYTQQWYSNLYNLRKESNVFIHTVEVDDTFVLSDITPENAGHAVDKNGGLQTQTVIGGINHLSRVSQATYVLFTEDDWVPCENAVLNILGYLQMLPTPFSSFRCANGLGCLVVRTSTLDSFAYWAGLNAHVTPIDSLSSIFYTREYTSTMVGKFGLGSYVYDGNSQLRRDELPYVQTRISFVHIGRQSTFSSKHHIKYAKEQTCGEVLDVHSPVVRDGQSVESVLPDCLDAAFSPCTVDGARRLGILLW